MQIDGALRIDLLSDTDTIDTSKISETVFLNTLIIMQYKLCVFTWVHFYRQINCFDGQENMFETVNKSVFEPDFNRLNKSVRKIIADKDFKKLTELRRFNVERNVLYSNNEMLDYCLAFGKTAFLSRSMKENGKGRIILFNSITSELTRQFAAKLREGNNNILPDKYQCRLLNLDERLANNLYKNMEIKVARAKLLRNRDISLDSVFQYS